MKLALDQESLIQLDYDAEINVLMVEWVYKIKAPWNEILNSYRQLVNIINQNQIPKLLIYTLNATCSEHDEALKPLFIQFDLDLATTNLKKVARVLPKHQQRKPIIYASETETLIKMRFIYESRDFNDKASALEWLKSSDD